MGNFAPAFLILVTITLLFPAACEAGCWHDNKYHQYGETFKLNECDECTCSEEWYTDRSKACTYRRCDPLPGCTPRPNTCCEFDCPDHEFCVYKGSNYPLGHTIADPDDLCLACECDSNWNERNPECRRSYCSPPGPGCRFDPNPTQCCAVICDAPHQKSSCVYKGSSYPLGHTIEDPEDACLECYCDSNWKEQNPECRKRYCSPPGLGCRFDTDSTKCCAIICDDERSSGGCFHNYKKYNYGDLIVSKDDPCVKCTCSPQWTESSRTGCLSASCAPPKNPRCTKKPGTCCEYDCPADGCFYNNKQYNYGDLMISKEDPCDKCTCTRQWTEERPTECLSELCSPPLKSGCTKKPGTCCDYECPDDRSKSCFYGNRYYRYGDLITLKEDVCTKCTCTAEWDIYGPTNCLSESCSKPRRGCYKKRGTCCDYVCPFNSFIGSLGLKTNN